MDETTDVAELLAERLTRHAALRDLVGDRIRPDALEPGEELPAVAYKTTSTIPYQHLGGASAFAQSRVTFGAYGRTRREANRVAAQIRDALDGLAGPLGGLTICDCVRDNDYAALDPPTPGDERWRRRRVVDFVVSYLEPTPSLEVET